MRRASLFVIAIALMMHLGAGVVAAQVTAPRPSGGSSLNFVDSPLPDVIRSLASLLGLTVVLSDVPAKRITFTTATPIARDDIGGVLESILESNGLVLVRHGAVAQVMPAEKAPAAGDVRSGTTMETPAPLGLITQLVPLQSTRADEAVQALKRIASPTARIEAVARSNAVLITDRGRDIARYLDLLRRLDEKPAGDLGLQTFVIPLDFGVADEIAASLGQLFGVPVGADRPTSLNDRGLSRALDGYRQREADAFQPRRQATDGASAATGAAPTALALARDSVARGALFGQTTIVAHSPTNSLIVRTAPANFSLLRETVTALDVRPSQVLFEVTVAEVALGAGTQFGIDWAAITGGKTSVTVGRGNPDAFDTNGADNFVLRVITLNGTTVRAVLSALATNSRVNVLSTPQILAANNREARINVGSKVPFVASTRLGNDIAVDRSVQYQDVGTTLTIIPTISRNDYVSVQILQEVSTLTTQTITAAFDAPVISTREAATRATLRDGQTVVIGGLIGESRDRTFSGVPLLMDIPILGALFRRQVISNSRTELVMFVTPHIVRSDADADAIRERTQRSLHERAPELLLPGRVPPA
jgi:general secretion pathway protein D